MIDIDNVALYQRKPEYVYAIQNNGKNSDDVLLFFGGWGKVSESDGTITISMPHGKTRVQQPLRVGDFLVKYPTGKYAILTEPKFETLYETKI